MEDSVTELRLTGHNSPNKRSKKRRSSLAAEKQKRANHSPPLAGKRVPKGLAAAATRRDMRAQQARETEAAAARPRSRTENHPKAARSRSRTASQAKRKPSS